MKRKWQIQFLLLANIMILAHALVHHYSHLEVTSGHLSVPESHHHHNCPDAAPHDECIFSDITEMPSRLDQPNTPPQLPKSSIHHDCCHALPCNHITLLQNNDNPAENREKAPGLPRKAMAGASGLRAPPFC